MHNSSPQNEDCGTGASKACFRPLPYLLDIESLEESRTTVKLKVKRCSDYGQPLLERYAPPANEPCTTGTFGCSSRARPESSGASRTRRIVGKHVMLLKILSSFSSNHL